MTKREILQDLFQWEGIDDIIRNITSGHQLGDDLKQELFLTMLEMPELKIQTAFKDKWLNYLAINILTKMWKSTTSPFYKKWRFPIDELNENFNILDDDGEMTEEIWNKIKLAIDKLPFVQKELIKMRYKIDEYDKNNGDKRDNFCKKSIYSYRKMEQKLKVGDISIDHNTIQKYHWKAISKLKKSYKDDI